MGDDEWEAVREPIQSGWITQGPKVLAFERAFADRHGVPHAIAVSSCTAALHLALLALGVGTGDEIIVPAFTWVSTANAVVYCGAKPVFVDIDASFNIDPTAITSAVTSRTKALIAVHLFGMCADMDAIRARLPKHVAIIEDAACAAGASYRGRSAGTLGDIGAFSFHPRKSITTGEGGMLTTSDAALAERMKVLRNHGMSPPVPLAPPSAMAPIEVVGYNYRLTDIQAAIGLVQLKKLDDFIAERARWATFYNSKLGGLNWLHLPSENAGCVHAWQSYVLKIDASSAPLTRDDLMTRLAAEGIGTRPGTHAVHTLDYYRRTYGINPEDFPHARDAADTTISIPLHNRMQADDYNYVAETILRLDSA
jgi:dTDP-4-amino-4,6-dideoxygalactose transaminase